MNTGWVHHSMVELPRTRNVDEHNTKGGRNSPGTVNRLTGFTYRVSVYGTLVVASPASVSGQTSVQVEYAVVQWDARGRGEGSIPIPVFKPP